MSPLAQALLGSTTPNQQIPLASMIFANPVGTERIGDQSLTNVSPDTVPAANWGGFTVPARLYDAAQGAIGNALGWVGGTEAPGIRAFHGSPYDFNAFDASKIGTGEGAQAYGHGLYFAGNEGTAAAYRKQLAPLGNLAQGATGAEGMAARALQRANGDVRAASDSLDYNLTVHKAGNGGQIDPDFQARVDQARQLLAKPNANGRMYEVNLNVQPQQLLDWDKPLSEQSPEVQNAIKGLPWGEPYANSQTLTGGQIVPKTAEGAEQLRQAGIPGIQYLDQGSRAAGEGTRNYVMFDPSLIDIVRKYGLAGALLGGTGALPYLPQQGAQQ